MPTFKFDWTLNVGNVAGFITFVVAIIVAWGQMKEDVHILQYQYNEVTKKVEEIKTNQEKNRDELLKNINDLRNQATPPKTRN